MKLSAFVISALMHGALFTIYFGRSLAPTLSPIWIEKGGAPLTKLPSQAKPQVAESLSSEPVSESITPRPSGTGGNTLHSSVDQWTRWGNAPPEYPYLAQKRGWEGEVEVRIGVAPGQPSRVTLEKSSGHSLLDEAALDWARNCKVSVEKETEYLVPILFRLREDGE